MVEPSTSLDTFDTLMRQAAALPSAVASELDQDLETFDLAEAANHTGRHPDVIINACKQLRLKHTFDGGWSFKEEWLNEWTNSIAGMPNLQEQFKNDRMAREDQEVQQFIDKHYEHVDDQRVKVQACRLYAVYKIDMKNRPEQEPLNEWRFFRAMTRTFPKVEHRNVTFYTGLRFREMVRRG